MKAKHAEQIDHKEYDDNDDKHFLIRIWHRDISNNQPEDEAHECEGENQRNHLSLLGETTHQRTKPVSARVRSREIILVSSAPSSFRRFFRRRRLQPTTQGLKKR